jgi:predicted DNA-binding protein
MPRGPKMKVLSLKVPQALDRRLAAAVRHRREGKSALVRQALERYLDEVQEPRRGSFLYLAGNLVGCVKDAPADLSSNPRYLADLGK